MRIDPITHTIVRDQDGAKDTPSARQTCCLGTHVRCCHCGRSDCDGKLWATREGNSDAFYQQIVCTSETFIKDGQRMMTYVRGVGCSWSEPVTEYYGSPPQTPRLMVGGTV
jgi:hypothetical protein